MRRYSSPLSAALGFSVIVAACSDGTEQWLAKTRSATGATAGSNSGPIAGSGQMPPPGGDSGGTPNTSGGSTQTGGSGSDPTGGTGVGGSTAETGGTAPAAGSSTGGSVSIAGSGGSASVAGSGSGGSMAGSGGNVSTAGSGGSMAGSGGSMAGSGGSMAGGMAGSGGSTPSGPFKVLIISTALEYSHPSIADCQKMVKDLGAADSTNGWTADVETNALPHFAPGGLKDYALIFSCNPTGRVFSGNPDVKDKPAAMKAFQDFIETEGKAFAGVHSASDFEKTNGFPWFTNVLMGAYFDSHNVSAGSVVSDAQNMSHPVLAGLSGSYATNDEWYRMNRDPGSQPGFKVLQRLASDSRPLTWVKDVGAGRMFYTARGHAPSVFAEAPFRTVVKNGILWTTRRLK
jgi:type 1 glutamine amidotransferase